MLIAVDPLLQRIDALPEPGCYSVTFTLAGNHERSVVMKVPPDADAARDVIVPEANMLPGWSPASASFVAVLAAVLAHGELEQIERGRYACATCEAQALFGPAGSS
jgi:hypothetical protein